MNPPINLWSFVSCGGNQVGALRGNTESIPWFLLAMEGAETELLFSAIFLSFCKQTAEHCWELCQLVSILSCWNKSQTCSIFRLTTRACAICSTFPRPSSLVGRGEVWQGLKEKAETEIAGKDSHEKQKSPANFFFSSSVFCGRAKVRRWTERRLQISGERRTRNSVQNAKQGNWGSIHCQISSAYADYAWAEVDLGGKLFTELQGLGWKHPSGFHRETAELNVPRFELGLPNILPLLGQPAGFQIWQPYWSFPLSSRIRLVVGEVLSAESALWSTYLKTNTNVAGNLNEIEPTVLSAQQWFFLHCACVCVRVCRSATRHWCLQVVVNSALSCLLITRVFSVLWQVFAKRYQQRGKILRKYVWTESFGFSNSREQLGVSAPKCTREHRSQSIVHRSRRLKTPWTWRCWLSSFLAVLVCQEKGACCTNVCGTKCSVVFSQVEGCWRCLFPDLSLPHFRCTAACGTAKSTYWVYQPALMQERVHKN